MDVCGVVFATARPTNVGAISPCAPRGTKIGEDGGLRARDRVADWPRASREQASEQGETGIVRWRRS